MVSTMSINVEKRILASSTRFFEGGGGELDDTWYHCERKDKVAHHNSWTCQRIGGVDDVIKPSNPQAITKLVPVSWYVPAVFHRAVLHRHLAETNVKID
jgi:hypothetical protein